ncbi:hypothetical protein EV122DRAFT_256482 [Schizophyllum commune]
MAAGLNAEESGRVHSILQPDVKGRRERTGTSPMPPHEWARDNPWTEESPQRSERMLSGGLPGETRPIIRDDDASTDEEGDLYPSFEDKFDTELDYAFRQLRGKPLDIFIDARGWGHVSTTAVLNLIAKQFHRMRTLSIIGVESLPLDLVCVEHVPSPLELKLRWCSTGSGIYNQRFIQPDLMQLASWLGPAIAKATSLSLLGESDAHILPGGRLFDSSAEWASALSANHITCLDIHDYRARPADWVTESITFRTPTLLSLHSPVTTWNRCLSWLDGGHHSYYYGMDPFLLYEACAWS